MMASGFSRRQRRITARFFLSATAVTDEDPHLTGALSVTDIDALSKLPERGVCMIRTQNGKRAQVYVSKCNIGRPVGGNGVRTVSLTCEEVS